MGAMALDPGKEQMAMQEPEDSRLLYLSAWRLG